LTRFCSPPTDQLGRKRGSLLAISRTRAPETSACICMRRNFQHRPGTPCSRQRTGHNTQVMTGSRFERKIKTGDTTTRSHWAEGRPSFITTLGGNIMSLLCLWNNSAAMSLPSTRTQHARMLQPRRPWQRQRRMPAPHRTREGAWGAGGRCCTCASWPRFGSGSGHPRAVAAPLRAKSRTRGPPAS
jgi:hypothetical protein